MSLSQDWRGLRHHPALCSSLLQLRGAIFSSPGIGESATGAEHTLETHTHARGWEPSVRCVCVCVCVRARAAIYLCVRMVCGTVRVNSYRRTHAYARAYQKVSSV